MKYLTLINLVYGLFSLVNLILTSVLFGVLADEGIKFTNFSKSYFLGIELNFYYLSLYVFILLILTIFVLIINCINWILIQKNAKY